MDADVPAPAVHAPDARAAVLAAIVAIAPETDARAIAPDRPLRDQIELDSIDWVNVVVELSRRLAIEIPESDYGRLATLDAIVEYLDQRPERAHAPTAPAEVAGADLPYLCHPVDGRRVTVRPIGPGDAEMENAFVERLSQQSRYERFMVTLRALPASKLKYLTDVDQRRHVALVATVDRDGREEMVGAARYGVLDTDDRCEFAIVLDDAWKHSGLAGLLMHALMELARRRGLKTMEGTVLTTNIGMLRFMRQLGFRKERVADDPQTLRVWRSL